MHRAIFLVAILTPAACRGTRSNSGAPLDTTSFVALSPSAPLDSTIRIVITDQPQVYANGHLVTFATLDSMLAALKAIDGEVWFYRQPSDIHLAAQQDSLLDSVMAAVRRHDLPFTPSRMADFGDLAAKRHHARGTESP